MLRTRTDAKALFREPSTAGKKTHPEYQYYEVSLNQINRSGYANTNLRKLLKIEPITVKKQ